MAGHQPQVAELKILVASANLHIQMAVQGDRDAGLLGSDDVDHRRQVGCDLDPVADRIFVGRAGGGGHV